MANSNIAILESVSSAAVSTQYKEVPPTEEEFLAIGAENLFTDELVSSVEAADIDHFEPSMAGFSISDGSSANINFGVSDGVLAVTGINY